MRLKFLKWGSRGAESYQSLSDITRGLLYSVNTAQLMLNNHYIESVSKYFDDDGNPIMYDFNIDEERVARIPLLALTEPKGLSLKEIEFDLTIRIDKGVLKTKTKEAKSFATDPLCYADRTSFEVSLAPSNNDKDRTANLVGVKLKFEEKPNPEGIERIMDEFRNRPLLIIPKKEWEQKEAERIKKENDKEKQ